MFRMTPVAIEELRKWRNAHVGTDLRHVGKDIELINALLSLPDELVTQAENKDKITRNDDVTTLQLRR